MIYSNCAQRLRVWFLILLVGSFIFFAVSNSYADPITRVASEKAMEPMLPVDAVRSAPLKSEGQAPDQMVLLKRVLPAASPVDPSLLDSMNRPAAKPVYAFPDDPVSLFRSLGIPKDEWGPISQNRDLLSKVNVFSPEIKGLYKSMSFFEKLKFNEKINGTTDTPLFTIDNKPAFITGKVKGYDTFEYLKSSADLDLSLGKITQQDYDKQIKQIIIVSKLTPDERTTLVNLLQEDLDTRQSGSAKR